MFLDRSNVLRACSQDFAHSLLSVPSLNERKEGVLRVISTVKSLKNIAMLMHFLLIFGGIHTFRQKL